jgi:peptidoglycan/xylan/chitin deacetylase (PgdA/CDA1 family)
MSVSVWKQCALAAYYGATLPARRRAAIDRAARHTEPIRILFYHRVADEFPNDWTMSTREFGRQVRWLHEHFELVSLAEAQKRIVAGSNSVPAACITFDDGYADNMQFAVPFLLERNVPFTYFVSTNHVLRGDSFPHDLAAGRTLPVNTVQHLRQLVKAGVEIGAHTRGHVDIGAISSRERLVDEIAGCKQELQEAIGHEVRYFAFPYGLHANLSAAAFQIAREAGYAGVCSAYGGYNFPGDDAFHLRRIHADPEFIRFKNWLTVDPRKVRAQRDFDPNNSVSQPDSHLKQDKETRRQGDKESTSATPVSPCLPFSLPPCLDGTAAVQNS